MKRILVPTDFSSTATEAYRFAKALVEHWPGSVIDVMHAYFPATEVDYPHALLPIEDFMQSREHMLTRFVKEEEGHDPESELAVSSQIKTELAIGFPTEEIVRRSGSYDLIVMGTTGASNALNRIFGSVASSVSRKSKCPVLMIPKGFKFRPLEHFLFAANSESLTAESLDKLAAFNQPWGASVHFVHVQTEEEFASGKQMLLETLLEDSEPTYSFTIEEVEGKQVADTLNDYAFQNEIDLIIMSSPKRTFWHKLFHPSRTRRMAHMTQIPLLVF